MKNSIRFFPKKIYFSFTFSGDCVQSSRLSLLNGRNGAPTCTPVYDDDDSPSSSMREDQEELPIEEDERKICDESRVEASDKMTSPMIDIVQSHEHDGGHRHQSYAMAASEDDKEMQSFASCKFFKPCSLPSDTFLTPLNSERLVKSNQLLYLVPRYN